MANLFSIARPYALAAFDFAREKQQLATWKAFLESAALVTKDATVTTLLSNREVTSAKLFNLYQEVLASLLDADRKNFLLLLADNQRLIALPEMADLFNAYFAALEKMSTARLVTAVEVKDDFKQKIMQALTKRTQHQVTLHCEVDPSIIGGAVIHMGDRVIDGSIRGKLTRLLETLSA